MDRNDNKISEQDAKTWTLIGKIISAVRGDPFDPIEASRKVAALIAPELDAARKYDEAYSRWPSVVDHERWWNETKAVLEQRPAKEPT